MALFVLSYVSGCLLFEHCFISLTYKYNNLGCALFNEGAGGNTGKTVAIILGGAAGVGFLVICLLFARNLMKKHDGKSTGNMRWIFFFLPFWC